MSYQKPMNPQRFDEPVYEQMNPKEKVEKKRPVIIQQQQTKALAQPKRKKPIASSTRQGAKSKSRPL